MEAVRAGCEEGLVRARDGVGVRVRVGAELGLGLGSGLGLRLGWQGVTHVRDNELASVRHHPDRIDELAWPRASASEGDCLGRSRTAARPARNDVSRNVGSVHAAIESGRAQRCDSRTIPAAASVTLRSAALYRKPPRRPRSTHRTRCRSTGRTRSAARHMHGRGSHPAPRSDMASI